MQNNPNKKSNKEFEQELMDMTQELMIKRAHSMYNLAVKRTIDVIISLLILIVLWPFMLASAIAIKLDSSGPVIFKQKRLGKDGKVFNMLKFRTMCVNAETQGSGVYSGAGDSRVTRVGNILRKLSIDELPQAVNILRGQMSFIGPRPPLTYHPWPYSEYTQEQKHMFDVRPGLTGWAQIHGRRTVEWTKRIEYNIWYVKHVSLKVDVEIFLKSFAKVLSSKDNQNTEKTVKDNA